jgi:hypothetical protein
MPVFEHFRPGPNPLLFRRRSMSGRQKMRLISVFFAASCGFYSGPRCEIVKFF